MTKYRTTMRCIVRAAPSVFAPELRRLVRGHIFLGYAYTDVAWVVRLLGGFVARNRLVEVGT